MRPADTFRDAMLCAVSRSACSKRWRGCLIPDIRGRLHVLGDPPCFCPKDPPHRGRAAGASHRGADGRSLRSAVDAWACAADRYGDGKGRGPLGLCGRRRRHDTPRNRFPGRDAMASGQAWGPEGRNGGDHRSGAGRGHPLASVLNVLRGISRLARAETCAPIFGVSKRLDRVGG